MSTQVQFRRGTTAAHSTFTGAVGEITVDTTKNTAVVHDGAAAGGYPLSLETDAKLAGWPVNSVKITTDNVNPGTLIGGTWAATTTPSATLFGETLYGWKRTA
jgi:hypothetical protein